MEDQKKKFTLSNWEFRDGGGKKLKGGRFGGREKAA